MRKYTNPAIKISRFMTENIITTSGTSGTDTTSFEDGMAAAAGTDKSNIKSVSINDFKFTL